MSYLVINFASGNLPPFLKCNLYSLGYLMTLKTNMSLFRSK